MYAEYVEWRETNPSDDLVTELLHVEFEDVSGTVRRLSKNEIRRSSSSSPALVSTPPAGLFGWMGKVLGDHPDQRRELVEGRSLIGNAIEELLRYEPPGPRDSIPAILS